MPSIDGSRFVRSTYCRFVRGADWNAIVEKGGNPSLLQRFVEELIQRLGRRIVRLAEVRVDLVVRGLSGTEHRDRNARVFERVAQSLGLRGRVGMVGDV